jgi:hypothetical protein
VLRFGTDKNVVINSENEMGQVKGGEGAYGTIEINNI